MTTFHDRPLKQFPPPGMWDPGLATSEPPSADALLRDLAEESPAGDVTAIVTWHLARAWHAGFAQAMYEEGY